MVKPSDIGVKGASMTQELKYVHKVWSFGFPVDLLFYYFMTVMPARNLQYLTKKSTCRSWNNQKSMVQGTLIGPYWSSLRTGFIDHSSHSLNPSDQLGSTGYSLTTSDVGNKDNADNKLNVTNITLVTLHKNLLKTKTYLTIHIIDKRCDSLYTFLC